MVCVWKATTAIERRALKKNIIIHTVHKLRQISVGITSIMQLRNDKF